MALKKNGEKITPKMVAQDMIVDALFARADGLENYVNVHLDKKKGEYWDDNLYTERELKLIREQFNKLRNRVEKMMGYESKGGE